MQQLRQKIIFYIETHQSARSFLYWLLSVCSHKKSFKSLIKWIFGGEEALLSSFYSLLDNQNYSDEEILSIFTIIQNICSNKKAQPIWDILENKRPRVIDEYEKKYVYKC